MTPEEEARQEIDHLLQAAGWQLQDYKNLNLVSRQDNHVVKYI